jgi:hypothetical protein
MSVLFPESWNSRSRGDWLDLLLGALLATGFLKFGTPANLAEMATPPADIFEFLFIGWPLTWAWGLGIIAAALTLLGTRTHPGNHWILYTLLFWLLWNMVSAAGTIDSELTGKVMVHFFILCALWLAAWCRARRGMRLSWFMAGAAAGFLLVLWNGAQQKFGGLEATRQQIYSMEGWENLPPEFLYRIARDRIFATLTYPNTLAALIILMTPATVALAWKAGTSAWSRNAGLAAAAIILTFSMTCLWWTGSKTAIVLALLQIAAVLFILLPLRTPMKLLVAGVVLIAGAVGFSVKFQDYFSEGARSLTVGRFGYWRAAANNWKEHPVTGSGPGTFYRVYQESRREEDEMTRLVHNDFLQQATDAGAPAALAYIIFVAGSLWISRPRVTTDSSSINQSGQKPENRICSISGGLWLGCLGWAMHSLMEWTLYVPAVSWAAFIFLAILASSSRSQSVIPHRS